MSGASPERQLVIVTPRSGEGPTAYADRVGQGYAAQSSAVQKKSLGQYLTPVAVAQFMAELYTGPRHSVRVLDPGAGAGILSCAFCELVGTQSKQPVEIELIAYESDRILAQALEQCLAYTQRWLAERQHKLCYQVSTDDFVIAHAKVLDRTPRLVPAEDELSACFDLVISNPPYFKLPKSDVRAQAAASVVHGQPNIYALFMAIAAMLLKPSGDLIFITPRSYAAGSYFRLFRERFFALVKPKTIHIFGSRREMFERDAVLQENIILKAQRYSDRPADTGDDPVLISYSDGVGDLQQRSQRSVPLSRVIDLTSHEKVLHVPVSDYHGQIALIVRGWPGNLRKYGLEISTGPVVAFRASEWLEQSGVVPQSHAPLLWMHHIHSMWAEWPGPRTSKPLYLRVTADSLSLLVPNKNYVLLRRFSAKEQYRRLMAAPWRFDQLNTPYLALENHLNYIHRPGGSLSGAEIHGLAAILNSRILDEHFRIFNGNTQVNAVELRTLPLPSQELIVELGRQVLDSQTSLEEIDHLIETVLGIDIELRNDAALTYV